jgi:hypothetical protein
MGAILGAGNDSILPAPAMRARTWSGPESARLQPETARFLGKALENRRIPDFLAFVV